jgi:outer membrane protein assembly factor BamB
MDDAGEGSRATRRQVLGATAGALAVGALPGRSRAQQASGPTVYVGSRDATLYAVDAATGEQEWAFTQPSDRVRSSPTVADGTVYVGSGDSTLYAVDAATGDQEWAFTQPSDWVYSSPTVADGTVYVGSHDATLYAVDAATGEQQWAFTQPSRRVYSSPTVAGGTVYVGSFDETLYAVDAATGSQEWAFTQPSGEVRSSPTVADGTVYVRSWDETLYAVDAATGDQEWAFTQPSDHLVRSSPTVADGTVYVGSDDETLYAVDAATGDQQWAFTQPSDDVYSSPTVADGTVYVGSGDSNLYAVDAATGEQEWAFTQPSDHLVRSSPTVADGTVYVGSGYFDSEDSTLYAVDAATGSQEWAFTQPSSEVRSSPTVVADPASGDSVGSRVMLGTLGHHGERADRVTTLDPAFFEVSIESVTESTAGETLDVTVAVENTGDASGTQTVELSASGLGSDSTTVSLDGGDSTTETLSLSTDEDDDGEYTLTVDADDDSAQQTVTVLAPAAFTVAITDVTAPVAGDSLVATVSIENTGEASGEQTIELSASGLGSDLTTVSLDGDDSTTETLSLSTDEDDDGEYTLTVDADDDEATETVTVAEPDPGDDGGASGDDSESSDDGGSGDGSDISDDSIDSESPGDGGLGTTEMAAIGGGGGLALLFGAYALMRRADDDGDDSTPERPSEPDTPGRGATTPRGSQLSDNSVTDDVDDLLDDAVTGLDSAAEALDRDSSQRAEQTLDSVADTLDNARASIERHDHPGLADRLASLDRRHDRLRQQLDDQRTWVPAEIPGVTRHSLSYGDIEKGGELGRGGNADVYHATAATDRGPVDLALKEPRMGGGETLHTGVVERMLQEAETWQQLDDHDHIVGVVDYGSQPLPWIGMEYMDAGHLGQRAEDMSFEQKLWTAIATTEAVRHAHRRGVAHLDLKPENILFRSVENRWDAPKVADWGLSKHLLEHSKSVEGMSPGYAAPEQFDDEYGSADDITDVYQLGAVFYELFTGRPPFEGQTFKVINKIQTETPAPPSRIADVPPALDEILLTALATEKGDRYETVIYLRDGFQQLRDDLSESGRL